MARMLNFEKIKGKIFFVFFLIIIFFGFLKPVTAERLVNCDVCGYCPPSDPPENWLKCVACLFPEITPNPQTFETLKIDPQTNLPPTPYPGRLYTAFGCIKTNLQDFTTEGASVSVAQIFLNLIFGIVGGISFLTLVYGSYIIIISQNQPERLNYGKRLISGAITGLIFTLGIVFLIQIIGRVILGLPGFN